MDTPGMLVMQSVRPARTRGSMRADAGVLGEYPSSAEIAVVEGASDHRGFAVGGQSDGIALLHLISGRA